MKRNDANHGEQQVSGAMVLLPVPLLGEVVELLGQLLQAHVAGARRLPPHLHLLLHRRRHGSRLLLDRTLHLHLDRRLPGEALKQPASLVLVLWKAEAWGDLYTRRRAAKLGGN